MRPSSGRANFSRGLEVLVMLYQTYVRFYRIHEPEGLCIRQAQMDQGREFIFKLAIQEITFEYNIICFGINRQKFSFTSISE